MTSADLPCRAAFLWSQCLGQHLLLGLFYLSSWKRSTLSLLYNWGLISEFPHVYKIHYILCTLKLSKLLTSFSLWKPTFIFFFASFYSFVLLTPSEKKNLSWSISPFQSLPWLESQEWNENLSCSNDALLPSSQKKKSFSTLHKDRQKFI